MKVTLCLLFFTCVSIKFSLGSDCTITFCEDETPDDVHLDLTKVGIKTLRELFVSSASIKCLNLGDNEISSIKKSAFDGLPKLTALNLSHNSIDFNDFVLMNEFANLKILILDEAFVIKKQSQSHPYQNNYGNYGHRRMTPITTLKYGFESYVSQDDFAIFPKLNKLSLCNYRTGKFSNWLQKFVIPNLTHLRLEGNGFTSDDDLPSAVTKNLTHLYLDNNEMSTFSGINLPKLRYLSLNNNKIRKLCAVYCNENSMTPRSMMNLEYLSIVGNQIVAIDADAFVNSAQLVTLDLAKNMIESFPRHTFDNMTSLQDLNLDANRLNRIPDICGLIELRELSMNDNGVTMIDEASFCNLPKLTYVSLRKNGLTGVGLKTFGNLPKLTRLDMSWNDLSQLPGDWLRSGMRLDELNLDGNAFVDIASMSLGNFEKLEYLSIGRNPFKTIVIGSLIDLPVNTTLDVGRVCESKDASSSAEYESVRTTSPTPFPYDDYE